MIGISAPVIAAGVFLIFSFATGFGTWPWQRHWPYADGELGIRLGATKATVWARIAQLQATGQLDTIGRNNDSRATTVAFSQMLDLDWWSFVVPPCCSCSLDLTFANERLSAFEKHCNHAPEFP